MVESQSGHYIVWVISVVGLVNVTNSKEHCSVIGNPLESHQKTIIYAHQGLNCANLLALRHDVVSPFGIFWFVTAVKCTPTSINRNELVTAII